MEQELDNDPIEHHHIFSIKNDGEKEIKLELFGAGKYIDHNDWNENGSLIIDGTIISCESGGSYRDFLKSVLKNPVSVERMYFQNVFNGWKTATASPINYKAVDSCNIPYTFRMFPIIDPYPRETVFLAYSTRFVIYDTAVLEMDVFPKTEFKIYLYEK